MTKTPARLFILKLRFLDHFDDPMIENILNFETILRRCVI